jgi:hypothetical protein
MYGLYQVMEGVLFLFTFVIIFFKNSFHLFHQKEKMVSFFLEPMNFFGGYLEQCGISSSPRDSCIPGPEEKLKPWWWR